MPRSTREDIVLAIGKIVVSFIPFGGDAARRLHLEQFPGYAPELNPDEDIWNYLKRIELGKL